MESWIQAHIYVETGHNEFLVNFLKPLVQKLRSEYGIESYHFLFEPEIMLRILTTPNNVDRIKALIDEAKDLPDVKDVRYRKMSLKGHLKNSGDGWKRTYKFLEAGSDFVLDLRDESVRKGLLYSAGAFMHYFLNQHGLNQWQEVDVHFSAAIERIIVAVGQTIKPLEDRIGALEEKIKTLESKA